MKTEIPFHVPFSNFAGTTFINCFASVYLFLENADAGRPECDCALTGGKPCDSGGNHSLTPSDAQVRYFFLFDTMCGRSSLRCRFDGERTEPEKTICEIDFYDGGADDNVDFLFGFAGYAYTKVTDPAEYRAAVAASIAAGRPVLAKVKAGAARLRVITGHDGDALLEPDYANAQNRPERAPAYDEIDALYVVDAKIAPRYTLLDGLRRIRRVMEYNAAEKLWDGYREKMGLYAADGLGRADVGEKKARMKRVAETMWHTFNCHNFSELFVRYRDGDDPAVYDRVADMKRLRDPALRKWIDRIAPCCGHTHDLAWALIGLEGCADWARAGYLGEIVELTIKQIAQNDADTLAVVGKIIEGLEAV